MIQRIRAIFSGRVQGVGFRYTVKGIAKKFPVKGFVRNLPSGEVEVVAEGDKDILEQFINAIRTSQLSVNIRDVRMEWSMGSSSFSQFEIRF